MTRETLPTHLTPLNLRAYFANAFGACGCSELEAMITEVVKLLEWHAAAGETRPQFQGLYPGHPGIFYLLSGLLGALGLSEHGISIRHAFLTPDGERLLAALRATPAEDIEAAAGEAYDGISYPGD